MPLEASTSGGRSGPRVLVFISHYLPGFKVGGPARSIEGFVDHLGTDLDIFIVCLDRDLGDPSPYAGTPVGTWLPVEDSQVMYVRAGDLGPRRVAAMVRALAPDVVYLNSLYLLRFTVLPLLAVRRTTPRPAILLAPRGSLSPGALSISPRKKRAFLALARATGLFRSVTWQGTSPEEAADIAAQLGPSADVRVAPNLVATQRGGKRRTLDGKKPGALKLLFLSRVSPKKNLLFALRRLAGISGTVEFTIVGPMEDQSYWARCREEVERLPPTIAVRPLGGVTHDAALACMGAHHLLFLPSLSENFGHVIIEALSSGTPVLISDQTSWRNLEASGAGWDIPLDQPDRFEQALQRAVDLDSDGFLAMSRAALALAERTLSDPDARRLNRDLMFELSGRAPLSRED